MVNSSLAQMQQRVERHFDALTRTRDTSSFPVFALEHDLKEADLQQIRSMLQSSIVQRPPSSRYWLLWVIYAAERGYDYEGDEYWGSFEDQMPGWEYNDRTRIRVWFRKFQSTYSGVTPSGPWAEHFRIIAWPITHAILPLYLQRQFAKLLYDLRFGLASRTTLDARSIGRLLSLHTSQTTKRFKVFLEQEELTGQIVLALLSGESDEDILIHPPTLKRIVADLERRRQAREWLKETQRVVADRFKGIGRGSGSSVSRLPKGPPERAFPEASKLAIRPSLFLRYAGAGKWSVFLEVKSFRPVAALSMELHSFLDHTRCRLNGSNDFKPTGWLLSGDRKGTLQSWPDPASPLIHFERPDPTMNHLLESECRLQPGPIWLFRIGNDGIARHVTGRIMRPGFGYILVAPTLTPPPFEGVTQCVLNCIGVNAYRVVMPSFVSPEMTARLTNLGLHVARTIRVWPAGLPGRGWDGEGSSEWLTTEAPCFGVDHDHPVESLSFHLDDEPETLIRTDGTEQPLFVRLPPLSAGTHMLTVKAKRSPELDGIAPTPAAEGFVQLVVRNPEPWTPGVTSHPGMIVRVDPDNADLDTFWRNKLSLSVNGPEGFTAICHATLQSADGKEILSEQVASMDLPITPDKWRNRFDRFLRDETRAWRYLEAATCTLTIYADTLGTCTLRFEHEPLPVRWAIRSHRRGVDARLLDDSGQDETEPEIRLYSMERPFESLPPPTLDVARSGYVVNPPGTLFVATHDPHRDVVMVSAGSTQQGFQGLGLEPTFPGLRRSAISLSDNFRLLGLWREARLCGFLAHLRHRQVMDRAAGALRELLCGENWVSAEKRFKAPGLHGSIESLAALVDKRTRFGEVLRSRLSKEGAASQAVPWFVDAAAQNNICRDRDLSEFALRLADYDPLVVAEVAYHPGLEHLLAKLIDNPAILRAARLQTLLLNVAWQGTATTIPFGRPST